MNEQRLILTQRNVIEGNIILRGSISFSRSVTLYINGILTRRQGRISWVQGRISTLWL